MRIGAHQGRASRPEKNAPITKSSLETHSLESGRSRILTIGQIANMLIYRNYRKNFLTQIYIYIFNLVINLEGKDAIKQACI